MPTSELDFTYQVDDALTNYGLTNDNIPFFDISLDKVAEIVHESNDPGQKTLARVCSAIEAQHFAAALNGYPYSDTCAGVLMDALQQKQQLQYAENLSSLPLIRVILDPTGYWVQDFEDLGA